METRTIEIFWQDLSERMQQEIAGYMGMAVEDVPYETNWDAIAMCSFDIGNDKDVTVVIDDRLPTIAVDWDGGEWFVQEEAASEILDAIPEDADREQYIVEYLTSGGVIP